MTCAAHRSETKIPLQRRSQPTPLKARLNKIPDFGVATTPAQQNYDHAKTLPIRAASVASHTKPTHIPNILGHINYQQDPVCLKRKQADHTDCLHPAVIEPYAESCENKRIICSMLCNTSYEAAHFLPARVAFADFLKKKPCNGAPLLFYWVSAPLCFANVHLIFVFKTRLGQQTLGNLPQ